MNAAFWSRSVQKTGRSVVPLLLVFALLATGVTPGAQGHHDPGRDPADQQEFTYFVPGTFFPEWWVEGAPINGGAVYCQGQTEGLVEEATNEIMDTIPGEDDLIPDISDITGDTVMMDDPGFTGIDGIGGVCHMPISAPEGIDRVESIEITVNDEVIPNPSFSYICSNHNYGFTGLGGWHHVSGNHVIFDRPRACLHVTVAVNNLATAGVITMESWAVSAPWNDGTDHHCLTPPQQGFGLDGMPLFVLHDVCYNGL